MIQTCLFSYVCVSLCAWLSCLLGSPNISSKPGAKCFREYQLAKFDHGYVNVWYVWLILMSKMTTGWFGGQMWFKIVGVLPSFQLVS